MGKKVSQFFDDLLSAIARIFMIGAAGGAIIGWSSFLLMVPFLLFDSGSRISGLDVFGNLMGGIFWTIVGYSWWRKKIRSIRGVEDVPIAEPPKANL